MSSLGTFLDHTALGLIISIVLCGLLCSVAMFLGLINLKGK